MAESADTGYWRSTFRPPTGALLHAGLNIRQRRSQYLEAAVHQLFGHNSRADVVASGRLDRSAYHGRSKPILAHCSDCHAQDGRDLKYFNYSNNSIRGPFRISWTDGAAGHANRQLHSLPQCSESRPAVESSVSARSGIGFATRGSMVGRGRVGLPYLPSDQDMMNQMFPSGCSGQLLFSQRQS